MSNYFVGMFVLYGVQVHSLTYLDKLDMGKAPEAELGARNKGNIAIDAGVPFAAMVLVLSSQDNHPNAQRLPGSMYAYVRMYVYRVRSTVHTYICVRIQDASIRGSSMR